MTKYLVATDFSPHAERALEHACALASLFGAEIELFSSAYIPPHLLAAMATGMSPTWIQEARDQATKQLEALQTSLRARGVKTSIHLSTDEPSSAICARAEEIGAALVAWQRVAGGKPGGAGMTRSPMTHAYYGPAYSDAEIGAAIEGRRADIDAQQCKVAQIADEGVLVAKAAETVAAGAVVGWFQGRMEWGPRALGNRSIVCDPRRADMKEIINSKIKRRESFRPFAPSILREAVPEWFETDDDVPFMMQVYPIRQEKRALVPAVTHVDGSGRLQTVTRESNPRYYALIEAFRALTGVPMVLNTSFNENEPVVCRPEEALDCFLRTKMDVLVMGDWFIAR